MATRQGSAAWGQISGALLSSSFSPLFTPDQWIIGGDWENQRPFKVPKMVVTEPGGGCSDSVTATEDHLSHLPMTTAVMVKSTKAFLMKNPFTSSLEMFCTLFLASCDRNRSLSLMWWSPLRLCCGFSPLLWVIFRPFLQKSARDFSQMFGAKKKGVGGVGGQPLH